MRFKQKQNVMGWCWWYFYVWISCNNEGIIWKSFPRCPVFWYYYIRIHTSYIYRFGISIYVFIKITGCFEESIRYSADYIPHCFLHRTWRLKKLCPYTNNVYFIYMLNCYIRPTSLLPHFKKTWQSPMKRNKKERLLSLDQTRQ